ncbi:MAG: hypothetical protein GAK45_02414 [Pseudomonas citronellolis]|nr:MAG: hypothetical protein GAK45_02414 [Pseudomonas citronellolis]
MALVGANLFLDLLRVMRGLYAGFQVLAGEGRIEANQLHDMATPADQAEYLRDVRREFTACALHAGVIGTQGLAQCIGVDGQWAVEDHLQTQAVGEVGVGDQCDGGNVVFLTAEEARKDAHTLILGVCEGAQSIGGCFCLVCVCGHALQVL